MALERDRFPRQKVCGGFLSPGAVEQLGYLGVLDDVRRAGAVQITSARIRAGSADVDVPFERPRLGISRAYLIMFSLAMRRWCRERRLGKSGQWARDSSWMTSSAPL